MNRNDLFTAIGGADDRYLLQSEKQKSPHRILFRAGIAAACVAVLCGTAMAIPPIRNAILGVTAEEPDPAVTVELVDQHGESFVAKTPGYQSIELTLERSDATPDRIQTYYVPEASLNCDYVFPLFLNRVDEAGNLVESKELDGKTIYTQLEFETGNWMASFNQWIIPADGHFYDTLQLNNAPAAVQDVLMVDGQTVTRFTADDMIYLYWSDGNYLFKLVLPEMPQEDYEPLLRLAGFDDLESYTNPINYGEPYIENGYASEPVTSDPAVLPDWLPEGFAYVEEPNVPDYPAISHWVRRDESITLTQLNTGEELLFGTPEELTRWYDVDDCRVMIFGLEAGEGFDDGCGALWDDGEHLFILEYHAADVTDDEMLRIIESIG